MKRYYTHLIAIAILFAAAPALGQQKFTGSFSNGYKGATLSFVLSADKRWVSNFTFKGYWRCGGSTEHITAGPAKSFPVIDGKVDAALTDPENGGASAFRFKLNGNFKGNTASGTFRMSITGLSCDSYQLKWTAIAK